MLILDTYRPLKERKKIERKDLASTLLITYPSHAPLLKQLLEQST